MDLMHEEPWFGFNVAYKMPLRDDLDPAANPFLGFDRRILASQTITEAEQATNSTDSRVLAPDSVLNSHIGEQINATHLPNLAGLTGNLPGGRISGNIDVSNLPVNIPADNVPSLPNSTVSCRSRKLAAI